ncbi:MAG: hypothetical protein ACI9D0_000790 [Bacteroidia bacterium]|jgi:hypothetical protein
MKKLASILVLGLALIWLISQLTGADTGNQAAGLGHSSDEGAEPGAEKSEPRLPVDSGGPQPDTRVANPDQRTPVDLAIAAMEDEGAVIRGRFTLPSGDPARGVELALFRWSEGISTFKTAQMPAAASGDSDLDGRFEFMVETSPGDLFALKAELLGYAAETLLVPGVAPLGVVDLGTCQLRPVGAIEGFIVDGDGIPIRQAWNLSAVSGSMERAYRKPGNYAVRGSSDTQTGAFRLENIPEGSVELSAHSQLAGPSLTASVEVTEGETTVLNLTYDGPDLSSRIAIIASMEPYSRMGGRMTGIRITGQGVDHEIEKLAGTSRTYAIDNLEDGLYTVTIDDERFLPWIKEAVRPGEAVSAVLKGSARIQLQVLDKASGEAIPQVAVAETTPSRTGWRSTALMVHSLSPLPEGGVLNLVPSAGISLRVTAPGYSPLDVPVGALLPGEVRPVTVSMLPE